MSDKQVFFDPALEWISKKSGSEIKALTEGYEPPRAFTNKETGEQIQADFSFVSMGGARSFTEIALKSEKPRDLVTRWKLLSMMAGMKRGKLYLLTPKGHKMFTKKLVDVYNINAHIHSI